VSNEGVLWPVKTPDFLEVTVLLMLGVEEYSVKPLLLGEDCDGVMVSLQKTMFEAENGTILVTTYARGLHTDAAIIFQSTGLDDISEEGTPFLQDDPVLQRVQLCNGPLIIFANEVVDEAGHEVWQAVLLTGQPINKIVCLFGMAPPPLPVTRSDNGNTHGAVTLSQYSGGPTSRSLQTHDSELGGHTCRVADMHHA
jgi:hypothetical protein